MSCPSCSPRGALAALLLGVALFATPAQATPEVDSGSAAQERAAPELKVRFAHGDRNVVRSGPGEDYAIMGIYPRNEIFIVIAKSGPWYNIRLSATDTGWIHQDLCESFQDLSDLEFRPNPRLYTRTGTFALTGYVGGYAFDRKSNSLAVGGRVGYYMFEFLVLEGGVSWTRVARPAEIVESLFGLTLEEEQFHMLYYNLNLTAEILPGRRMVPFITGGAGSNISNGRSEPAINLGVGAMLYLSQGSGLRWEVRNHRFSTGAGDSRRSNNNFEMIFGTAFLF